MNKILQALAEFAQKNKLAFYKDIALIKLSADKHADVLININLKNLTDKPPEGEDKAEFYRKLRERASKEGIFSEEIITYIKNLTDDKFPSNDVIFFVKWVANNFSEYKNLSDSNKISLKKWYEGSKPNLNNFTPNSAVEIFESFQSEDNKSSSNSYKTNIVMADLQDGYRVIYIPGIDETEYEGVVSWDDKEESSWDRVVEGNNMNICLGEKNQLYGTSDDEVFSLRDSSNTPHATLIISGNRIQELKGQSNSVLKPKYTKYLLSWFDTMPKPLVENNDLQSSLVSFEEKDFEWCFQNLKNPWCLSLVRKYKKSIEDDMILFKKILSLPKDSNMHSPLLSKITNPSFFADLFELTDNYKIMKVICSQGYLEKCSDPEVKRVIYSLIQRQIPSKEKNAIYDAVISNKFFLTDEVRDMILKSDCPNHLKNELLGK